MAGCQKEGGAEVEATTAAVKFSSVSLATRTTTILDGDDLVDAWESDDRVGIFTSGFTTERSNVEYAAATTASATTTTFEAVSEGDEILYPNGLQNNVTFSAYYPFVAGASTSGISFDISGQVGDVGSVDLMCAEYEWIYGTDSSESAIAFSFEHKLAKVVFTITANDTLGDLSNLTAVSLTNINTVATYSLTGVQDDTTLAQSKDVELTLVVAEDKKSATVTAILHPDNYSGKQLEFTTSDGRTFTTTLAASFAANTTYTYSVALGYDYVDYLGQSDIDEWGNESDGGALDSSEVI
ncbi:MAG: fimbrillin family protein [Rikenellaceae bacterium]